MTIPDYQTVMAPLVRFMVDGQGRTLAESVAALAVTFGLSREELSQTIPSGTKTVLEDRVGWARTYLKKAGLLAPTRRGYLRITPRGMEALEVAPERIDVKFLDRYPEFVAFRSLRRARSEDPVPSEIVPGQTPLEALEAAYAGLRDEVESEILRQVKLAPPEFFERLVVELLVRMGYGGSRQDAGRAVGGTGDGGIDGIIKEDRLGLDAIYIQAKRWDSPVSRPEIQKFAGALQGNRARKGVFLTTSSFTKDARDFVDRVESRIVLIDGDLLASLMFEHNLGVSAVSTYEVKRVDSDLFGPE